MTTRTNSSAGIRARNQLLDEQLADLLAQISADVLLAAARSEDATDPPDAEESWSVAQQLAHLGEFTAYFASELDRWVAGSQVVVGRTAETSAVRNDAVVQAPSRSLNELLSAVDDGCARLGAALARLDDHHLDAMTQNVTYGPEPLTAYLDRYVVGHKAAHLQQLGQTLDALTGP